LANDSPAGRPLDQALAAGPLSPPAGAALADDLLAALESLHREGRAHGAVEPSQVRLLPSGSARLLPPPAPGEDRPSDVRAVALLLCNAVGVAPAWSPSEPLRETERAAPALAATLRAIAQGSLPLDAGAARAAIREAAGGLVEEEAAASGRAELAARAGAPAAAVAERHPPAIRLPNRRSRRRPLLIAVAVAALLVLLAGFGVLGWGTAGRHPSPPAAAAKSPSPLAQHSPSPTPVPTLPTANGPIQSVVETAQGQCAVGASCAVEVDVHFQKTDAPMDVSWQFQLVDSCTSNATYVPGNTVHALAGWVHVVGTTRLTLPGGHPLAIVAITTAPAQAASAPLLITNGTC
jgi:hypothetical protein